MRRTPPWVAVLLLLCPLAAQDQPATKIEKGAAASRLEQLNSEQQTLFEAWRAKAEEQQKAAEKAAAAGQPVPAMPMQPDFNALCDKYLAAAKEFPGEDAVPFLLATFQLGGVDKAKSKQALDELFDDHLDSPKVAQLGGMMPYLEQIVDAEFAKSAFAKIEKHGKNAALVGWIAFARNEKMLRSEPATSKAFGEAKALVAAAVQKAGDKRLQREFDTLISEQEKFGIGMTAPDIAGIDLDGVAFKLSDYQGKVVFLDFWGDW